METYVLFFLLLGEPASVMHMDGLTRDQCHLLMRELNPATRPICVVPWREMNSGEARRLWIAREVATWESVWGLRK